MSGKWIEMRNNQYFITDPQSHTSLGEKNRTLFTNIPMTHGLLMIQSPEAGKVSKTLFVSSTKSVWCSYIDGYFDRNRIRSRHVRWDGESVCGDHTLSLGHLLKSCCFIEIVGLRQCCPIFGSNIIYYLSFILCLRRESFLCSGRVCPILNWRLGLGGHNHKHYRRFVLLQIVI